MDQLSTAHGSGSVDVGHSDTMSSGPSWSPGFEHFADVVGPSSSAHFQLGVLENSACGKSLEFGNEAEQSSSKSHVSSELAMVILQTPLYESVPTFQSGTIEIVLPFEEELVDAQNAWNISKALRLKTSNELAAVEAISKIKECQDFTLPRKKGSHRKKKKRKVLRLLVFVVLVLRVLKFWFV